jgi:GNAT superfamily N-acetyltransferase
MIDVTYRTVVDPAQEESALIDRGLHEFNLANLGEDVIYDYARLAVFSRDDHDHVIGGIHGELVWEWLYIRALWVNDTCRGMGIGSQLLSRLEAAALSRGFSKSHLETTDFQALGFYLKNGYEVFGELEGKPAGSTWYYLKKDLSLDVNLRGSPSQRLALESS